MVKLDISLPDALKEFVDERVGAGPYKTSSDYIGELIRRDQIAEGERQLKAALEDGLRSGASVPVDATYWQELKDAARGRK
jgi:antitoxin ParD1/3/4